MSDITLPTLPAIHMPRSTRTSGLLRRLWFDDPWLTLTFCSALVMSVAALWFASAHHWILLYSDATSHLSIARRVIDNATPGLAQLGGIWLPLPHLLMLPFIWNGMLWRSGLAGSIPAMLAYIVAAVYLYRSALRLTNDGRASFIGSLVFIINPNILYLQTTPLSETILMAAMIVACYYYLVWAQEAQMRDLILAAGVTFLATLARYDGWALFAAAFVMIVPIGLMRHETRQQIVAHLFIFGMLGGLGIALWFLWNKMIFGDLLYFQHSAFSSQTQQMLQINAGTDQTYHQLPQAIHDYTVVSAESLGPVLLALAVVGVLVFLSRNKVSVTMLAGLIFLVPFAFYIVSLYSGQAIIWAPHAAPAQIVTPWYNVRYGSQIIAPAALFLAVLVRRWPLGRWALLLVTVAQSVVLFQGGIITVQDGQFGSSCSLYSSIPQYLAQHYRGGTILQDTYDTRTNIGAAGIDLDAIVYEGSGKLWLDALSHPADHVEWVIVKNRDILTSGDMVSQHIKTTDPHFLANFSLATVDVLTRAMLYHHNGLAPLPNRKVIPQEVGDNNPTCGSVRS